MLPNFLIVGAAKAGTTSLYYYLKMHPQISFPDLKEPKYFSSKNLKFPHNGTGDSSVDYYSIKTIENYESLFSNIKNQRVGEASPDYLYFYKNTPSEIKNNLGDIPIIIILRDPVKRAYSAYNYLVRDSREKKSFKEALQEEENRIKNNYDFIWAYKKAGLYYNQVKAYKESFTEVKIIIFEDFIEDVKDGLKDIFEFLRVEESYDIVDTVVHNPSGVPNNLFAKFILSRNNALSTYIREILKKYIDRLLLEKISSFFLSRKKINENDEKYLIEYFKDDVSKLRKYISNDLSAWSC